MKKYILLVLVAIAALASSCNIAKTCPTYAKGKDANLSAFKSR
jgi:hypothetical protein